MHNHRFINSLPKDDTVFMKAAVETCNKDRCFQKRCSGTADMLSFNCTDQIFESSGSAGLLNLTHVKNSNVAACDESEKMTLHISDGKGFCLFFLQMIPSFP